MAKSSITYSQVAEACQTLLGEGQKITLRAIVSKSGGSPNSVLQFWKQWQREQEDITLAALDEDLSPSVKQAILAECARKVSLIKAHFAKKITESDQQWQDMQALVQEANQQKQQLQSELTETQTRLLEQNARISLHEQQLVEADKRLKDMEDRYQAILIAHERSQAEKIMMEKQATDWQDHYHRCEQELKTLQAAKHAVDIELATLKAHLNNKITV